MIAAVINGDDFGLAPAINEGILKAHAEGCLTSTSLSVAGPFAEEAVQAAAEFPDLGIGLHLTLVGERPVADPEQIPSLIDADGGFSPHGSDFARRWLTGQIRGSEVRHEIRAQLTLAQEFGVLLTHVDSHDHVHVLPGLFEILLEEMDRVGLKRLRIPLETKGFGPIGWSRRIAGCGLAMLAWRARRIARLRGFLYPDAYQGFRGAGQIDSDSFLARIDSIGPGVTELSLHPAAGQGPPREDFVSWGYRWGAELAALLDPLVRARLDHRGIRLMNFNDLPLEVSTTQPGRNT